jgi:hypothetical protein
LLQLIRLALCPKCHKNISANRFQRHLRRCGTSHKHYPGEIHVPSATPAWERPDRGILVSAPGDKPKWAIYLTYVILIALVGSVLLLLVQAVVAPQTTTSTSTFQVAPSSVSSTMIFLSSPTATIPAENESNPTGLKLGPVTICTHDCGFYPATYITLTLFVNYTSPLHVLDAYVNGTRVWNRTFASSPTPTPYAYIFKASVPNSLMTFTPNARYEVSFTAAFDDMKTLEASAIAISNP